MSYLPPPARTANGDWRDLADELDRWQAAGRVAVLWWRDDDAVAPTSRLERLLRLAAGVPVALAVIPALARRELVEALPSAAPVAVLQHGWRHANHAGEGRKSEYAPGRPPPIVGAEITAGRARLAALFGRRAVPVFVPPWNRLADEFLPLVCQTGVAALSATSSRRALCLPAGLVSVDVHLDLVAWKAGRGFIGEAAALGALAGCLAQRRLAGFDTERPIGLLTHHRVLDDPGAAFLERLVALTAAHPAVRWADIGEFLP